ncbi:uncharacterized protein LOC135936242 [Cloeon dipterum]|uniref:uncharacterized protein LOC135936242 n=1 Tax=Cloeon dipterum TaxID=197152 RepID=UPI00321FFC10
MINFKYLVFASGVLCVAFALNGSTEIDSDKKVSYYAKDVLSKKNPKEWCEEGTYENENGECKECKSYLDNCRSTKECCDGNFLECNNNYCLCPDETVWNDRFDECQSYPTLPSMIDKVNTGWALALAISAGIVGLAIILVATFLLIRCHKTRKSQRSVAVLRVPISAFSPSAPPPPPSSSVALTIPVDQLYPSLTGVSSPSASQIHPQVDNNAPPPTYEEVVQKRFQKL